VKVGINGGVEYQSDVGVWRNPIILPNQSARRVFEETFNYSVGGHVRV
jgi:hypothetical protein